MVSPELLGRWPKYHKLAESQLVVSKSKIKFHKSRFSITEFICWASSKPPRAYRFVLAAVTTAQCWASHCAKYCSSHHTNSMHWPA